MNNTDHLRPLVGALQEAWAHDTAWRIERSYWAQRARREGQSWEDIVRWWVHGLPASEDFIALVLKDLDCAGNSGS